MNPTVIVLSALLISCHASVHDGDSVDEQSVIQSYAGRNIEGAIERFRTAMRTGSSKLGIPIMDPLKVDQYPVDINKPGLVEVTGLLTNAIADGASGFNILKGQFTPVGLKTTLSLHWPVITASTDYLVKGLLADTVSLHGNGDLSVIVRDFSFATEVGVSVKDAKVLYVRTIKSEMKLGSLNFKATGLYDDEELSALLSALITDLTPQLIADYHDKLMPIVDKVIAKVLDGFLATMTVKDLLDLLK